MIILHTTQLIKEYQKYSKQILMIQEIIKESECKIGHETFEITHTANKSKREYVKTTETARKLLLESVLVSKISIKESARKLRINYSTAKNIIKCYLRDRPKIINKPFSIVTPSANGVNSLNIHERNTPNMEQGKEPNSVQFSTLNATPKGKVVSNTTVIDINTAFFDFSEYPMKIYSEYDYFKHV